MNLDYWDAALADPVNAVSVLRAKLDAWLVDQAEQAGALVMPGIRVDALVVEDGRTDARRWSPNPLPRRGCSSSVTPVVSR